MDFYALRKLTIVGFNKKEKKKKRSREGVCETKQWGDGRNISYASCTSQCTGM